MKKLSVLLGPFLGISTAWAGDPVSPSKGPDIFFPLIATFAVVYFMMIRPQMKREKATREKLSAIEKGDDIVTKGGILGKVTHVADKVITIEIAEKVRVKVDRNFVHEVQKQTAAPSA